jgi:hypothetical protein
MSGRRDGIGGRSCSSVSHRAGRQRRARGYRKRRRRARRGRCRAGRGSGESILAGLLNGVLLAGGLSRVHTTGDVDGKRIGSAEERTEGREVLGIAWHGVSQPSRVSEGQVNPVMIERGTMTARRHVMS